MIELMWKQLQAQINAIKQEMGELTRLTERAETAGGVASSTLADAPLAADQSGPGDMLWITDGRKLGEGAGAGTGVIAYYNPGTDEWFRLSDDTAVTV